MRARKLLLSALVLAAACQDTSEPAQPDLPVSFAASPKPNVLPNGQKIGTLADSVGPRTRYRIDAHRGPVIDGSANIYLIWYGNWGPDITVSLLTDLTLNIGSSPYMQPVTRYADTAGRASNGAFIYSGTVSDMYSRGVILTRADVSDVVRDKIAQGQLPADAHGLYMVLATADVSVSDLAQFTCAFHQPSSYNGTLVNVIYIGSPIRMPGVCVPQQDGPNDTRNGDAMASLFVAELANAVTDPTLSAWYDRLGYEIADKCAWQYGATYTADNGSKANVRLGQRDYLLQQLWLPTKTGGYCTATGS